jgi:hypothetical protein
VQADPDLTESHRKPRRTCRPDLNAVTGWQPSWRRCFNGASAPLWASLHPVEFHPLLSPLFCRALPIGPSIKPAWC